MSTTAEIANNRADDTSSPGLSSPPSANSPSQNAPATDLDVASRALKFEQDDVKYGGLRKRSTGVLLEPGPVTRKPPGRRRKEPDGTASHDTRPTVVTTANSAITFNIDGKQKKPRAARGTSAAFQKKMQKKAEEAEARRVEAAAFQATRAPPDLARGSPHPHSTNGPPQNGNFDAIQNPISNYTQSTFPQQQQQQTLRTTSGQIFDPIRSAAARPASPKFIKNPSTITSTSPSISNFVDQPKPIYPTYPYPQITQYSEILKLVNAKESTPPEVKRPRISPPVEQTRATTPDRNSYLAASNDSIPPTADVMDIDTDTSVAGPKPIIKKPNPSPDGSTAVSVASHSPKPSRAPKEAPVALPSAGSGLLSGSIFGSNGLDNAAGSTLDAPTVVLDIPLTGESNQYINFSELAEKRYGFNALHPRLAAQRKRLADVAALGAAIENATKGSGMSTDEKSVDLSDEGDDSNIEMGGTSNGLLKSGEDTGDLTTTKKPRKKRMMKEDMYDKDDGFVDDAELAWEEQAAVSKDGFFVYSGLLVPEGEEAKVERTETHPPKRGGRGGGRGSRGGRGGGSRGGASSSSFATNRDNTTIREGKVPGRKPRTTKADKERMEREKAQRENLAVLASKPVGYSLLQGQVGHQGQGQQGYSASAVGVGVGSGGGGGGGGFEVR